ncbi:hypothetical protein GCM10010168_87480 [Actinoplanes ianthinogenes]|uniref:Uncharacterized protein n=1 Tax=Actinoplanes ianthinogenes TaxID=122358 RepID=A0ABN6CAW3_9ACTN|nr:hypothetical protein [Actinoplanes ianthinogenes]BCJ42253.1 hypothetical protein Aiant_29100 [Actinoplanes ianthinogenes]GGR54968.1 hypothetical protein GCM10010168_87480 [Actinoplanes ianthinogenes]
MSQDPYSGQPFPGVPNPDVPGSVPPAYGAPPPGWGPAPDQPPTQPFTPGYAQPGYPPAGYPQPPFGQPGYPPPPPKKSRVVPIVLLSIAIVLVLCVGGLVTIGLLAEKDDTGDDKDGKTPTAADITVVEPETLGGRPKLTTSEFGDITKTMEDGLLTGYPGATTSFGAFYGTPAKKNMVMAIGVAAPIPNPELELSKNITSMSLTGISVDDIVAVDTGSYGGAAKCGSGETAGVDLAVCIWSDKGSVGMLVWYYTSVSKAKTELPALRKQIEQVS